jgi:uncharacterized membrane protein affecting hemolysin expression
MDYDRNTPILVLLSVWFYEKKMGEKKIRKPMNELRLKLVKIQPLISIIFLLFLLSFHRTKQTIKDQKSYRTIVDFFP